MTVEVWCDGSGNRGGPGGCGYVATHEDGTKAEGCLPLDDATNQQAEILAAAYALHMLPAGSDVVVYSDSEYVVKGFTEWLPRWRANRWRTAAGAAVKNRGHWTRLIVAADRHARVRFQWVEGHAGNPGNERADKLAGAARQIAKERVAA